MAGGGGREVQEAGDIIHLWPIYAVVWQKPILPGKAITLQLKTNLKKERKGTNLEWATGWLAVRQIGTVSHESRYNWARVLITDFASVLEAEFKRRRF